jgi:hypothetical protein
LKQCMEAEGGNIKQFLWKGTQNYHASPQYMIRHLC